MSELDVRNTNIDALGGPLWRQRDTLKGMVLKLRQLLDAAVTAEAQLATTNEQLATANAQLTATNQELNQRIEQADTAAREAEELRQQLAQELEQLQATHTAAIEAHQSTTMLLEEARSEANRVPGLEAQVEEITAELAGAQRDLKQVQNMHPIEFALMLLADDTHDLFGQQSSHLRRIARWTGSLVDGSENAYDYRLRIGDSVLGAETRTWAMQPRLGTDRRIVLALTSFKGNTNLMLTLENMGGTSADSLMMAGLFELLGMLAAGVTDQELIDMISGLVLGLIPGINLIGADPKQLIKGAIARIEELKREFDAGGGAPFDDDETVTYEKR